MPYVGPAPTPNAPKDLQGGELKLDADADTTITADTDDQIDIKVAGSDEIKITSAMLAPASADGSALGGTSNEWSDLYLADSGVIYFGADQDVTLTHAADTSLTCNLMMAATTFEPSGAVSAGDNAAIGYSGNDGLILTGQGSSNDITVKNDAATDVITIATGTTNVDIVGDLTAGTLNADGDTAAGDNAAIGYTAGEGIIITGQGSTGDITLKNDADEVVFQVPTGTDDIKFPDGAKAIFGADSDLSIYNNGTSGTFVAGTQVRFYTADFGVSNAGASESMISASQDGAVTLYHDNAAKIATVATGINVKGGVTFDSDTAEANNLDDYEEGSWTPAQNGVTAAAASGVYTKVGRMVYAFFTMTTATTSDASSMQVSGLPFACASIDGSCAKGYDNYEATNNSHAYVPNGQSYVQFTQNSTAASTNAVHTGKLFKICEIYQAAT